MEKIACPSCEGGKIYRHADPAEPGYTCERCGGTEECDPPSLDKTIAFFEGMESAASLVFASNLSFPSSPSSTDKARRDLARERGIVALLKLMKRRLSDGSLKEDADLTRALILCSGDEP